MVDEQLNVTLIDFGLSKLKSKNRFKSIIGSPLYMAPEVFSGKYNNKCDIWALGILLYHMISGQKPFDGDNLEQVQESIQNSKLKFSSEVWKKVSKECKDLIRNMIVVDYKKRYSAADVLTHPWIDSCDGSTHHGSSSGSSKNVLESLQNFH
jgi:calcium-dependent protein kinase